MFSPVLLLNSFTQCSPGDMLTSSVLSAVSVVFQDQPVSAFPRRVSCISLVLSVLSCVGGSVPAVVSTRVPAKTCSRQSGSCSHSVVVSLTGAAPISALANLNWLESR